MNVTQIIHSHTYPNGLVLVAEPMASLESAAFSFLVPAGCVHDPPELAGLSNFTCELALRGCGDRDNRQFVEELDNLGVERGEGVSDSHASFSGATLAKNLLPALAIYADVLRRPRLPAEEIDASRQLLLQEVRAVEDEPSHKVMQELRRRQYPFPWGRPSHGSLEGLTAITLDHVRDAHAQLYQPQGTILGVAGRVEWERLKDEVGRLLGDWQPVSSPELNESAKGHVVEHLPYESNQTQIGIAYDSVPYRHPHYYQAWGAVSVLSGGMSSRLFTEVREKRSLCYTVYATHHSLRDRGSVFCYAGTSAERAQETLDVTLGELVRLTEGIEPHEINRLKARVKSTLIMQQESSSARSASVARDWYHLGRVRTLDEVGQNVDALTCESISQYVAAHPPGAFTIVTLGPKPLEVPVGVS